MQGIKQVKYIKHVGSFQTSHQPIYLMTIYLDTSIYLIILCFTIHQTLPKILMYLQQNLLSGSLISVKFSVKSRV